MTNATDSFQSSQPHHMRPDEFVRLARKNPRVWMVLKDQKVEHHIFGEGMVRDIKDSDAPFLIVDFTHPEHGNQTRHFDASCLDKFFSSITLNASAIELLRQIQLEMSQFLKNQIAKIPPGKESPSMQTKVDDLGIDPDLTPIDSERFARFAGANYLLWKMLKAAMVFHEQHGVGTVIAIEKKLYPQVRIRFDSIEITCLSPQFARQFRSLFLGRQTIIALCRYEKANGFPSVNRDEINSAFSAARAAKQIKLAQEDAERTEQDRWNEISLRWQRIARSHKREAMLERIRVYNAEHENKLVLCELCSSPVKEDRLESHLRKRCPANPDHPENATKRKRKGGITKDRAQQMLKQDIPYIQNGRSSGGKIQQTSIKVLNVGRRRGGVLRRRSY